MTNTTKDRLRETFGPSYLEMEYLYSAGGNPAYAQVVTRAGRTRLFTSYGVRIAFHDGEGWILDPQADGYSQTTSRYLNDVTGTTKPERAKLIRDGHFRVEPLNRL